MKKIFTLVLFITCSISALSQVKQATIPGAGFTAAFPSKPQVEKNQIDSKAGKIESTSYNCEGEDFIILVSENIYPENLIIKLDDIGVTGILDGVKNGAIKNIEAQLEGTYTATLDEKYLFDEKYKAIKFAGTTSDVDLEAICVVKENHFFILILMGNTKSDVAQQFVKSFKII